MPAKIHPLRPLNDFILVCEGSEDYDFINAILRQFALPLSIVYAGGVDSVSVLASILSPSVYIKDRDFTCSFQEAKQTLNPGDNRTVWPFLDIEAYLLHSDWIWAAIEFIRVSPVGRIRKPPKNLSELEKDILTIANDFVADHAGRQMIEKLNRYMNPIQVRAGVRKKIGNAGVSNPSEWESHLREEARRLRQAANEVAGLDSLAESEVIKEFNKLLSQYSVWAKDISAIRENFSGKRIFMCLAETWQVGSEKQNAKKPWRVLRDAVVKQADEYSRSIQGFLSDDSRLGDFGLLAGKILGRKI